VQYVSCEVHTECFKAKDFNISVLIPGQETKFRNLKGNDWCDKGNGTIKVFDILIYICQLQLGLHPVAVVQYTQSIHRTTQIIKKLYEALYKYK
jgi:hypothetical protein